MIMTRPILSFLVVFVLVAGLSVANPVMVPLVDVVEFGPPGEVSLCMTPDGSGTPFAAAWNAAGDPVDALLRIQIVDESNLPWPDYPAEDVWLMFDVSPGTAKGCVNDGYYDGGLFFPDDDSDGDGWFAWALPLRGGGWSEGPVRIYIAGMEAMMTNLELVPPLPIRVNSPDINGDLAVDLTDITLFAQDIGAYHYRSDLHWDGVIDLADIVFFAQGIGAVCP
jgi:hypothetical protein